MSTSSRVKIICTNTSNYVTTNAMSYHIEGYVIYNVIRTTYKKTLVSWYVYERLGVVRARGRPGPHKGIYHALCPFAKSLSKKLITATRVDSVSNPRWFKFNLHRAVKKLPFRTSRHLGPNPSLAIGTEFEGSLQ